MPTLAFPLAAPSTLNFQKPLGEQNTAILSLGGLLIKIASQL